MTRKRLTDGPDRGLSEVIAFTIVFGIIVSSVALVSVVGFSTLQDIQTSEQGLNAQRAFQSVGDNLGELQTGQTPARTSEIDAQDGTIRISALASSPEMTVRVDDGDGFEDQFNGPIGSLTYELPSIDRTIGIQSGAVFNGEDSGAAMIESPRFVCRNPSTGESSAIVSVMVLAPTEGAQGQSGTDVQIRGSYNASSRLNYSNVDDGTPKDVEVTVSGSQFDGAWANGIADSDGSGGWTMNGGSVECNGVDNVFVRVTVVNVELR
jgi:hypothetical protein